LKKRRKGGKLKEGSDKNMVIIEDSKKTKVFKYKLLSRIVEAIDNWKGAKLQFVITIGREEMPDFKKSGKLDKKNIENILLSYIQKYLGDKFLVSLYYVSEVESGEMRIETKEPPKDDCYWRMRVEGTIFWLAKDLLDELIEKPYSDNQEREIVLRELGKEYDRNPLDKKEISDFGFSNDEIKHIRIFKTLRDFEKEGMIQRTDSNFSFSRTLSHTLSRAWRVEFKPTEKFIKLWEKKKKERKKGEESEEKEKIKPSTFSKNCWGYFRFSEISKPIRVSQKNKKPFLLLQALCYPKFGAFKSSEGLFETIRTPKDTDGTQWSDITANSKKIEKIQYTIKELQGTRGLKGKLKYVWDNPKNKKSLHIEFI